MGNTEYSYQLKRYKQSKSIRIHVRANRKVLVTAPLRTSERAIESFVKSHTGWIEERINSSSSTNSVGMYSLEIIRSTSSFVTIDSINNSIVINTSNPHIINTSSRDYIREHFREKLMKILPEIKKRAAELNIDYSEITLRSNTSRWGSRSSSGRISLNIWLASLPEHLLWYVVHHEFAHTVHMNHSKDFWATLEAMYTGSKNHKKEIKQYSVPIFG